MNRLTNGITSAVSKAIKLVDSPAPPHDTPISPLTAAHRGFRGF